MPAIIKALDQEVVLLHILKHISSKELLSIRPVCKQWDDLVKSHLRSNRRNLCIRLEAGTSISTKGLVSEGPRNRELLKFLTAGNQFLPSVFKLEYNSNAELLPAFQGMRFDSILKICDLIASREVVKELVVNWLTRTDPEDVEDESTARLVEILRRFSPTLETLDIHTFPWMRAGVGLELEAEKAVEDSNLQLQLPSLKVLKLPGKADYFLFPRYFRFHRISRVPSKFILSSCRNVGALEVRDFKQCQLVVEYLVERSLLGRLGSLSLSHVDRDMMDRLLSSEHLALEELHLHDMKLMMRDTPPTATARRRTKIPIEKLAQLLKRIRSTLRKLTLSLQLKRGFVSVELDQLFLTTAPAPRPRYTSVLRFTEFPCLRKLTLIFPPGGSLFGTLATLNFSPGMPSLETLVLINPPRRSRRPSRNLLRRYGFPLGPDDPVDVPPPPPLELELTFKCTTVRKLVLDLSSKTQMGWDRTSSTCLYFRTLFPNVEKLVLKRATNSFLQQLWTSGSGSGWTLLRDLDLTLHKNTQRLSRDLMFFGLSADLVMKYVSKEHVNLSGKEEEWWGNVPYVMSLIVNSSAPTLLNLEGLRRLRIAEVEDEEESNEATAEVSRKYQISNTSAYLGFGGMKTLRTLEIGASTIDEHGKRFLRENLPELIQLDLEDNPWDFGNWLSSRKREELEEDPSGGGRGARLESDSDSGPSSEESENEV